MKKIICSKPDGSMLVVQPVINTGETISEDQAIARAVARLPSDVINPQVVDASALPTDRRKRAAWKQNGALVEVDETKWAQVYEAKAASEIDGIDRLQFEHLFDLENRTRVLEAKLPITRAQYRDALISRWKALNPLL